MSTPCSGKVVYLIFGHNFCERRPIFTIHSLIHHCAKFYQYPSIKCRVIANFRLFKMADVCHLGFIWDIFEQPTKGTWSLSLCKIWWQSMQKFRKHAFFTRLAWKRLFTPSPKNQGLGEFHPFNGEQYQRIPQKAHPYENPRGLSHQV